jgi:ssDNA-binding Zn-finger/Zn-ribbon topoisomerase 1
MLLLRTARRKPWDGAQFWGCSAYPRCTHISQLDAFPDASLAALERRR